MTSSAISLAIILLLTIYVNFVDVGYAESGMTNNYEFGLLETVSYIVLILIALVYPVVKIFYSDDKKIGDG